MTKVTVSEVELSRFRKYHFWRGFIVAGVLVAVPVAVLASILINYLLDASTL